MGKFLISYLTYLFLPLTIWLKPNSHAFLALCSFSHPIHINLRREKMSDSQLLRGGWAGQNSMTFEMEPDCLVKKLMREIRGGGSAGGKT